MFFVCPDRIIVTRHLKGFALPDDNGYKVEVRPNGKKSFRRLLTGTFNIPAGGANLFSDVLPPLGLSGDYTTYIYGVTNRREVFFNYHSNGIIQVQNEGVAGSGVSVVVSLTFEEI